jgi:hypothetical protein
MRRFERAFDDDGRGQLLQRPTNPAAMKIGAHHQPNGGIMGPSIVHQAVDDVEKPAVKSRLTAQDADPHPRDLMIDALSDEVLDGCDGHFYLARSLVAGAVAVDAFQVAIVSNVNFDVVAAGLERFAEWAADPRLTTDELDGIQQQSS